jgi:hypothetical protein
LLAKFKLIAVHRTVEELCRELRAIPFEPLAPVRDQLRIILQAVNRLRKTAALELVPWNALWHYRKPVGVFSAVEA